MTLSLSAVLTDTGSISTVTILGHKEGVWAGWSNCIRPDQQLSLQAVAQKSKKNRDDSFLYAIASHDDINGKRSLNTQNELAAHKQGSNILNSHLKTAKTLV